MSAAPIPTTEPRPWPALEAIAVRPMVAADVPAACAIEEAVQPRPWTADLFAQELAEPSRAYRTAWWSGGEGPARLLGFAGVLLAVDEAHVTNIAVDPAAQGRGVGGMLLAAVLRAAVDMGATAATLEVRAGNASAQRLYARFGFAPVGVRPGYYAATEEDAVIMWVHDISGAAYAARLDAAVRRADGEVDR